MPGGAGAGEGAHFYPILGDMVGFKFLLCSRLSGLNERPQRDLEISLAQGQEINGKVLGN